MMKKMRFQIIIIVILSALINLSTNVQGDETTTEVRFQTVPLGADILINGEVIGRTPLVANLSPGIYDVKLELPGFETWDSPQTTIYGTSTAVIVQLSGIDLSRLPSKPVLVRWHQSDNQVYFVPFEGDEGVGNPFVLLDIENESILVDPKLPHLVEDRGIRQQLGLNEFDGTSRTLAFFSPTMTYVGFTHLQTQTVSIARVDTGEVVLDSRVPIAPTYDIMWSPEEKYAWIDRKGDGGAYFISLLEDSPTIYIDQFESANGDTIRVTRVIAAPSDAGQALILARQDTQNVQLRLWLVDIETQQGILLPVERPFDAGFTQDGSQIVVAHESGISLVETDNISQIELVSNVVSSRWTVYDVNLAPTLEYALVYSGDDFTSQEWLYKMPVELP